MRELINLQGTIFLLIAVGFFLKQLRLISAEGQKALTDLEINVILPCSIIKAFCMDFSQDMGKEILIILVISILIQILSIFYGRFFFRKQTEARRKCLQYGTICSNAGFLGNPIAEGIYGGYGLMLASVFLIPVRMMMWSAGIAIFSGGTDWKETIKKTIKHPCILACILGLLLLLTGFRFPQMVQSAIGYLGACNTAVSILVIGMILGDMDLRAPLDKTVISYSIHRLLLLPLIVYIITGFFPFSSVVRGLCVLLTAMPAGATTSILSAKYDQDPAYGTSLVIISTMLSLITLTLWNIILA